MSEKKQLRILVINSHSDLNPVDVVVVSHDDGIQVHVHPDDGPIPDGWEDLLEPLNNDGEDDKE